MATDVSTIEPAPAPSSRSWEGRLSVILGMFGLVPFGGVLFNLLSQPSCSADVTDCSFAGRSWQVAASNPWEVGSRDGTVRFEARGGAAGGAAGLPVQTIGIRSQYALPFDQDVWLRFAMMVEPGPPSTARWLLTAQTWQPRRRDGSGRPPPWSQALIRASGLEIAARSGSITLGDDKPRETIVYRDTAYRRGRWYHFVYHLRYSQMRGALEVWRDGLPLGVFAGPLGYADSEGPHLEIGINRALAPEKIAVQFAAMTFGPSACEAAIGLPRPRGAAVSATDCRDVAP